MSAGIAAKHPDSGAHMIEATACIEAMKLLHRRARLNEIVEGFRHAPKVCMSAVSEDGISVALWNGQCANTVPMTEDLRIIALRPTLVAIADIDKRLEEIGVAPTKLSETDFTKLMRANL
jgi:hypothetical protein